MVKSMRSRMRTKRRNKGKSKKLQYKTNIRRSKKGKKKRTKRYMNKRGGALFSPPSHGFEGAHTVWNRDLQRYVHAVKPTTGYVNQGRRRDIGGETNFQGEADAGSDERRRGYRVQAESASAGKHGKSYEEGYAKRKIDDGNARDKETGEWIGEYPDRETIDSIYTDVKSNKRWCREVFHTPEKCISPLNTAGFCKWDANKKRCRKNKESIGMYEGNKGKYYELMEQ
jgi:hypothetical protein